MEDEDEELLEDVLQTWISNIGNKYIGLKDLETNFEQGIWSVNNKDLMSAPLATVVGNLKNLKNYSVNLALPTKSVLDLLDSNKIELKHLTIAVEEEDPIEESFNSVMAAQSSSTLSSLSVNCGVATDALAVISKLISFGYVLQYLTHLKFDYGSSLDTTILFLDILKKLTRLEGLEFALLQMNDACILRSLEEVQQHDNIFYNKMIDTKSSAIKPICLIADLKGNEGQNVFRKSNSLFNFMFSSCPMLEKFDLLITGEITASGSFNLDFRNQTCLKQIKIKQFNCRYYAFSHEFGKYWKNINDPITEETLTSEEAKKTPYCINLAWDNNDMNIDIQLSDCKR